MTILRYIFLLSLPTLILSSCFRKDEKMIIIENKGNQNVKSIIIPNPYSIYNYNDYIDLDSGKVVSSSPISSWDLAFDASPEGYHIHVNAANSIEIARTGRTDFTSDFSGFNVTSWYYDASSGNPDSTAVGNWVTFTNGIPNYTNEVYLVGKNNGNGTYNILRKISFIESDDRQFRFITALPGSTTADTVTITKDPAYRYSEYSFSTPGITLHAEPPVDSWDIVAGSYRTTLYTDLGVVTPYTVRGVLTNYPSVEVIKVYDSGFFTATATDTIGKTFSKDMDAIGYDWKDYNSKDSNPYAIVPNLYYFIRTRSGNLVKLEFTGYTSANAEYGYPAIRFVTL